MNYNKLPNKYLVLFEQAKQHMVNHKKESFLSKKLQSTAKNRNRYEHIHIQYLSKNFHSEPKFKTIHNRSFSTTVKKSEPEKESK